MVDICLKHKIIYFFDSYNEYNYKEFVFIRLIEIFSDYINKKSFEIKKWDYIEYECPKQNNSYDCGVFVCKFIDYISRDQNLDFTQDDISYFRILIGIELIDF